MLNEDQYMERTPDLIARIRKMREAAEQEMDRFTRVSDYEVRRVAGQRPKTTAVTVEAAPPFPAVRQPKKSTAKSASTQTSIAFAPAPAEPADIEEDQ